MPVDQRSPVDAALAAVAGGDNRDPFAVLGPHREPDGSVVIRAFLPHAQKMDVRLASTGDTRPMERRGVPGVFEARLSAGGDTFPDYRLLITYPGNHVAEVDDPYRYGDR